MDPSSTKIKVYFLQEPIEQFSQDVIVELELKDGLSEEAVKKVATPILFSLFSHKVEITDVYDLWTDTLTRKNIEELEAIYEGQTIPLAGTFKLVRYRTVKFVGEES